MCAAFYGLTAQSATVYYRRRVFSNVWDGLLVGILPFCTTGFLAWMIERTLQQAPASQIGRGPAAVRKLFRETGMELAASGLVEHLPRSPAD